MTKPTFKGKLAVTFLIALIVTAGLVVSAGNGVISSNQDPDSKTQSVLRGDYNDGSTARNALSSSSNLSERIDELLDEGKLPFLFFYADECPFCHQQMPILDELEYEYAEKLTFMRINADERPHDAELFNVSAFPTMFVISDKNESGYVQ
jgi:thiol-disulfide isomerase/thioredoxin